MRIRVPDELQDTDVLRRLHVFCEAKCVTQEDVLLEAVTAYVECVTGIEAASGPDQPEDNVRIMRTCSYCDAPIGVMSTAEFAGLLVDSSTKCPACGRHPRRVRPTREPVFTYPECLLPCQASWSDWRRVLLPQRVLEQLLFRAEDDEWQRHLARRDFNRVQNEVRAELSQRSRHALSQVVEALAAHPSLGGQGGSSQSDLGREAVAHSVKQKLTPSRPSTEAPSAARHPRGRIPERRLAKPKVRCEATPHGWRLFLDFPDDLMDVGVRQGGDEIHQDSHGHFAIPRLCDDVEVLCEDGSRLSSINLGDGPFLVFRHRADWTGVGTGTRTPSRGFFTALVPESWRRDVERSGPAPITPEGSAYPGYIVHFFRIGQEPGMEIAFRDDADLLVRAEYSRTSIRLFGECLPGDPEELGPVYFGELPRIALEGDLDWRDIETIEVSCVSESGMIVRTRPDGDVLEQRIRASFAEPICGELEVRLLDANGDELGNETFGYAQGLHAIKVEPHIVPPTVRGHVATPVKFEIEEGVTLRHVGEEPRIEVESSEGFQVAHIPPSPLSDETTWEVEGPGGSVSFRLTVPRIWWRVCDVEDCREAWRATSLLCKLSDFKATSRTELCLRLPNLPKQHELLVGFEVERAEPLRLRSSPSVVPLRRFCDDVALNAETGQPVLKLFLKGPASWSETVLAEVSVALLCKVCGEALEHDDVAQHICSHAKQLMEPLTYDEIRQHEGIDLPAAILCCSYCGHYVTMETGQRPQSRMKRHIEDDCTAAKPGSGPVQLPLYSSWAHLRLAMPRDGRFRRFWVVRAGKYVVTTGGIVGVALSTVWM